MKPIYHITHASNLAGIVADGGLQCVANMRARADRPYRDIAYPHIQDRRAARLVPCGPRGTLADYVPFYFAPRSPMLYTIDRGNVPGYTEGQGPIVHLVTDAEVIASRELGYAFTDGHAVMAVSDFYTDLADLQHVDWEIMVATYWNDTNDDPDRKRRRQAEFLVHRTVPWDAIREIGVISRAMVPTVKSAIAAATHQPVVSAKPDWYY